MWDPQMICGSHTLLWLTVWNWHPYHPFWCLRQKKNRDDPSLSTKHKVGRSNSDEMIPSHIISEPNTCLVCERSVLITNKSRGVPYHQGGRPFVALRVRTSWASGGSLVGQAFLQRDFLTFLMLIAMGNFPTVNRWVWIQTWQKEKKMKNATSLG